MRGLLLLLSLLLFGGCASTKPLGVWVLPDGQHINLYQTKSEGVTGPSITAIGAFLCHPIPEQAHETGRPDVACEPLQGYHASGSGLIESLTGGLLGSAIQAGMTYGVGVALVKKHDEAQAAEAEKNREVVTKENEKKIKADREQSKEKIAADKLNKSTTSISVTTPPITVIAPTGPAGPQGDKGDKGDKGAK